MESQSVGADHNVRGPMPRVVTLTMNPAIDVATSVDRVLPERKLYCHDFHRDAGGGGINVARVVHRLGADAEAIYPVGGFSGHLLRQLLDDEGVVSDTVPVDGETRQNFTALELQSGEEYRFVLPGPDMAADEWRRCMNAVSHRISQSDVLVLSGSLPAGVPSDFYAQIARAARSLSITVVLDTSGPPLEAALDAGLDLIKPNLRELKQLTGALLDDEASRIAICRELVTSGKVAAVALTLGAEGALLVTAEQAWRAGPLDIAQVSAVGAGDSFLGAMVWALTLGKTLDEGFRWGIAAGSAALLSAGTDLCHAADVRRLVGQVIVEPVRAPA
jgi:6-phosphofructokinase 2